MLLHLALALVAPLALAPAAARSAGADEGQPPRGLVSASSRASDGYVLFTPILSRTSYLIDNQGRVVHTWRASRHTGNQHLLADGRLLVASRAPDLEGFRSGGVAGLMEEIDWNGRVLWRWRLASERAVAHHDFQPMPGGNILVLGWEIRTRQEALAAGRRAELVPEQGLWPDFLLEIEPQRPDGARVVWEWHVWDHLVQDHDPEAAFYGDPAAHPGRLDINAVGREFAVDPDMLEQLKALGYIPDDAQPQDLDSDFLHVNSIDYHPGLDQIALSVPEAGEIWILDHGTTSEQAAGSRGGRYGRGGEILYRWGNPAVYGRGSADARRLFFQHDARWIPDGFPGAGNLTLFNNGTGRPEGSWSSVLQIVPPLLEDGRYALENGRPFGPDEPVWEYAAADRTSFFAPFISGAHRTANANTLVCSGPAGRLFEVTPAGDVVWDYLNPYSEGVRPEDGWVPPPVHEAPWAVFQAERIPADHPGLAGRELAPLDPQPPTGVHR